MLYLHLPTLGNVSSRHTRPQIDPITSPAKRNLASHKPVPSTLPQREKERERERERDRETERQRDRETEADRDRDRGRDRDRDRDRDR